MHHAVAGERVAGRLARVRAVGQVPPFEVGGDRALDRKVERSQFIGDRCVVALHERDDGVGGFEVDGVMWRWTIDLATGTVEERQLDDRPVEFPRIDDRLAGLPARYGIAVGDGSLLQYDLETGAAQEHQFGDDANRGEPGEAVFVPADSTVDERAGWYLTYVYDPVREGSDLVILDASDITAEPVARVRLPQRVPH